MGSRYSHELEGLFFMNATCRAVCAMEPGKFGITVNCVAPGAVEIERTKLEAGDYAGTWAGVTPLGRVGVPLDVALAVVFFEYEI